MTVEQQIASIIRADWQVSVPGRVHDVPEPGVILENDEQKVDLKRKDELVVKEAGPIQTEALAVGWNSEREELTLSVQLTSADRRDHGNKLDGSVRVFGYANDGTSTDEHGLEPGEQEEHGGLVGEVKRIMRDRRKEGIGRFDDIFIDDMQNLNRSVAVNKYRAVINLRLRDRELKL